MFHPVLGNKKYLLIYFGLWVVNSAAHTILLYIFYDLPLFISVIDAVVYNGVYLLLGIGIWYIVKFNQFELKNIFNLIVSHILAVLFIVGLWLSVAGIITSFVFDDMKNNPAFTELMPVRVILGIMFYMIISLIYYLVIYYQNLRERIEHEANIEAKFREAELNALKAQINPHFIFNSLNSISALTITDPALAQEMIVRLSEFFRMTLKKENKQFTHLKEEIKYSRLYFEIEKIRFKEKLNYIIDCELQNQDHKIPHMILQPLLENAIKHGVQESIEAVEVHLICRVTGDHLILKVINHFDPENESAGNGIGHANIRERLKLIYNRVDLFKTEINDNQYIAILKFPLNSGQ